MNFARDASQNVEYVEAHFYMKSKENMLTVKVLLSFQVAIQAFSKTLPKIKNEKKDMKFQLNK